ncbi:MAG: glycosyltransferase family 2 protein [Acidobacteriota bacterium]|nr:glycosyltransferase family 2 protein [Acidobacteriota bacterium]
MSLSVSIVIPALNEEEALPSVISEIPHGISQRIVVVDNGSNDDTGSVALQAGAEVVAQPRRGYGRACLAGMAHLRSSPPDILVFLDADYSDYPEDCGALLQPILTGDIDMVCGSRVELAEVGALAPQVRYGNALATFLIRLLHGFAYTDMGPFRAIRWEALRQLEMCDPTYGWNAEMQVKAVRRGLKVAEVDVRYRRRIGRSKISGSVKATVLAGVLIIWTIIVLKVFPKQQERRRENGSI